MHRLRAASFVLLVSSLWACSSSSGGNGTPTDAGPEDSAPAWQGPDVEVACNDTIASVLEAPSSLPTAKGAIVRCARDADMPLATLQAHLTADGYQGKPLTSGAHVYRVQYRTERGDPAHTAGYSSAVLFLPDTPRAAKLPAIVSSHGSRGQAGVCALYEQPASKDTVLSDFERQVYPLVGSGYAVIAPDLAGYAGYGAPNNPPSAYASTDDVGRSTLDGVRALKLLAPSILMDKVIITGHSQGGHTALSALALVESYAPELDVAGVVTYAPLWMPQRTWGALLLIGAAYPVATYGSPNGVSVWYHYTHGELLDGPGHGLDVFAADKRAAVKAWVDSQCWGQPAWDELAKIGADATQIFDPAFASAIGSVAASGGDCPTAEPAHTMCTTWMARYLADRPHLTGKAATTPIVLFYGDKDTTIPPDRMMCALDRLHTDMANVKVCVGPNVDHSGIVSMKAGYASDWIANLTLGGPDPGNCGGDESTIVDSSGNKITCNSVPPND